MSTVLVIIALIIVLAIVLMRTVINIDKLVGKDFEKGLAALKAAAEKWQAAQPRLATFTKTWRLTCGRHRAPVIFSEVQ